MGRYRPSPGLAIAEPLWIVIVVIVDFAHPVEDFQPLADLHVFTQSGGYRFFLGPVIPNFYSFFDQGVVQSELRGHLLLFREGTGAD